MYIFEQYADAIITPSASGIAPLGIEATAIRCSARSGRWSVTRRSICRCLQCRRPADRRALIGAPGRDERLLRTARAMIASLG